MADPPTSPVTATSRLADLFGQLRAYLGLGRAVRRQPIRDTAALTHFLDSRASFIAQTSLYGYLRTRAGQRYPDLFENDDFIVSINIAKWHMWLACLSDLAIFCGGLMARRSELGERDVDALMRTVLTDILDRTGTPQEADHAFPDHAARLHQRLASIRWRDVGDDESSFTESPAALVRWAPIMDELKQLDEGIVRNSVRFHWNEVRRDLRQLLDAAAVAHDFNR